MKIKQITYASGRVEYVCKWRNFNLKRVGINRIKTVGDVVVVLIFLPLFTLIALHEYFRIEKRVFIQKDTAIRFRKLYIISKNQNRKKIKEEKEQEKIAKAGKKIVSKKFIK